MAITVAELSARLTADTTQFKAQMSAVGGTASTVASGMTGSFKTFFSSVNATGVLGPFGAGLAMIDTAVQGIGEHAKGIGPTMQAVGAGLMGIGALGAAIGGKDEQAMKQLKLAVEGTGASWTDYKDKVEGAIASQANLGRNASDTQNALRILTTATNNTDDALIAMKAASELAAARHMSLSDAATSLAKAHDGSTRALKGLGIEIEKAGGNAKQYAADTKAAENADAALTKAKENLTFAQERLSAAHGTAVTQHQAVTKAQEALTVATAKAEAAHKTLNGMVLESTGTEQAFMDNVKKVTDRLQGQDSAAVDTFSGHIKVLATHFENTAAQLGTKYGPALMGVGAIMTGLPAIIGLVSGAFGFLGTAMAFVAANPIVLIGVAIAALAAGLYEAYQHVGWFRDAVQTGFKAVSDVISTVWNIIGPILNKMGGAISAVAGPIGSIIGGVGGAIGSIGSTIGGLFGHALGGTVAGQIGSPQLIMAHGGERIIPVGQNGGGGGTVYNLNVSGALDPDGTARAIQKMLLDLNRRTGTLGFT